jgi:acyl-[acyl-carrier-protein]-phospholipid O-acyltransferase/long-chain-fatty-acid--[acyl-carrier-protein] ligase
LSFPQQEIMPMHQAQAASQSHATPASEPGPSLLGFLVAQFLGAFNDNVYKMVLSLLAVRTATSAVTGNASLPLIGAIFILPFLLFSGYAGHVADLFSKRHVLVAAKGLEIVAMSLGLVAFLIGRFELMLGVLFLMALQSTFFSPAKYGILPEILPSSQLSHANGLVEMSTFLAIILGTAAGSAMFATWQARLPLIGLILTAIAVAGTAASCSIPGVPPAGSSTPFRLNPWGEIISGIRRLYGDRGLWLTAVGIAYFWFLGALLQMDLILLGKHVLGLGDVRVGLLQTFLALGIGAGSLAAGRLSGHKVELGLVPLGALGMGVGAILLALAVPSYPLVVAALVGLGCSGGLFIVPLNAFLQHRSGAQEKGRLLATSNFLSTGGILLASAMLWLCQEVLHLQADQIVVTFGFVTLAGMVYAIRLLPDFLVRFLLWLLTHTLYRIRMVGREHVPLDGPALLVCNHISLADGFLVGACVQRFVRFMVFRGFYERRSLRWLFRLMQAIPVAGGDRQVVRTALDQARQELQQGHVVCIFAEGAISRTGNLLPFKRGFERIVHGLDVPVIPVHLDGVWGSIFSFKDGRFGWKWPRRIPRPVTVSFGAPLPPNTTAGQVRQAVMELAGDAVTRRRQPRDLLPWRFVALARRHWRRWCMADSTGRKLTYGQALVGSLVLARWLGTHCPRDTMVGLLLPSSVGGALANIATLLTGKIPVNLNFTAGRDAMQAAAQQCGIRTILTSRQFVRQARLAELDGMVYLEEVLAQMTRGHKVRMALLARLAPTRLLHSLFVRHRQTAHDLATVVFSSGSTGAPKGVMLSHHNILSNLESMQQVFTLTPCDRMLGILPFFHSFGFTVTLWLPILTGFGVVYHANPTEARVIGNLARTYGATLMLSTFCGLYVRQCDAEDFAALRYAIVGAERLRPHLAEAFKARFGVDLLEGYGCTEMAPVVAVNVPDVVLETQRQIGGKPGTVGHPLPGVAARVVDPDTGQPLPCGVDGMLQVKGPNRMLGYLGQPDRTAEVLQDDWYVTGDIASIDETGFIRLTDRLSRFSKIGGEMVPHLRLEEAINAILGDQACLVTAVPDAQKGERLVVLCARQDADLDTLWEQLRGTALPRLWLPRREEMFVIGALPVLGTGKVDLRQAKRLAQELALRPGRAS